MAASDTGKPPEPLWENRRAAVALTEPNTLRMVCDKPPRDPKRWFDQLLRRLTLDPGGAAREIPVRVTDGNEVTFYIHRSEAHPAMGEAIEKVARASGPNRFVYLVGWSLRERTPMGQQLAAAHFENAAKSGAQVRALLWWNIQQTPAAAQNRDVEALINQETNALQVEWFNNSLPNSAAILDSRVLGKTGSHHQKILLACDGKELVAFAGGMDIGAGVENHDVQCRFRGPAAFDLLQIFLERWEDHPDHKFLDKRGSPLGWQIPEPGPVGRQIVQVGRTYGNGCFHKGIDFEVNWAGEHINKGYTFAPRGEQTAFQLIAKGIQTAERFIYIEDQYLVSMEVSRLLADALPRIKHLTIVLPDKVTDLPQCQYRVKCFLDPLFAAAKDKVRVFRRVVMPNYVHSKLYIFDDEMAIVGSANCNRRGFTHDSEVMVAICDQPGDQGGFGFAHRLRIALWARHLGLNTPEGKAELADGVASAVHWTDLPRRAEVSSQIDSGPPGSDPEWYVADPDGR